MDKPLLLIGVHSDELAFGSAVASVLGDRCDVLRVEHGLENANPTPDDQFHYRIRHDEMYRQVLQQLGSRRGPVIDLHSGLNENGRCADIYCESESLLRCLESAAAEIEPKDVRFFKIVAHEAADGGVRALQQQRPVVWTYIPEVVWKNPHFFYVGIEVFLASPGAGDRDDHAYARDLVLLAADCAASFQQRVSTAGARR